MSFAQNKHQSKLVEEMGKSLQNFHQPAQEIYLLTLSDAGVWRLNLGRGGAQCLRIGGQEVIFVFGQILHFSQYTRVRLGLVSIYGG